MFGLLLMIFDFRNSEVKAFNHELWGELDREKSLLLQFLVLLVYIHGQAGWSWSGNPTVLLMCLKFWAGIPPRLFSFLYPENSNIYGEAFWTKRILKIKCSKYKTPVSLFPTAVRNRPHFTLAKCFRLRRAPEFHADIHVMWLSK